MRYETEVLYAMQVKPKDVPNRVSIIEGLRNMVAPWLPEAGPEDIANAQLHLIRDLGMDSVGILQVLLGIEKHFGVVIANDELDMQVLSGLGSLALLVESKLNANN